MLVMQDNRVQSFVCVECRAEKPIITDDAANHGGQITTEIEV